MKRLQGQFSPMAELSEIILVITPTRYEQRRVAYHLRKLKRMLRRVRRATRKLARGRAP